MNTVDTNKFFSKTNEAINKISSFGYKVEQVSPFELHFYFKGKRIIYYPKKEWATGATICDCRGLGNLLTQIKTSRIETLSVSKIKEKLIESIADAKERQEKAKTNIAEIQFEASANAFQFILDFINEKQ